MPVSRARDGAPRAAGGGHAAPPTLAEIARAAFSLDDFRRFAGAGVRNHHTHAEEAQRVGLASPIAPGALIASWIWGVLAERRGARWADASRLSLTYLAPVCAGDELRLLMAGSNAGRADPGGGARGPGDDGREVVLRVENAAGRAVVAGSAGPIDFEPEEAP
jgi:acyl dehydratase